MHRTFPARFGAVCGLAASLGFSGAAIAQEGVAFKNIMGSIGILPEEKDPIRYRERAPLVIPPKAELRPPMASDSFASNNPQWPNDPDVAAKRRRAEDARRPVTWSETRRMSDNNARLTPDELGRGRSADKLAPVPGSHRGDNARDVLLMTPDQLRAGRKVSDDEAGVAGAAGGEPARKVLTDPPSGMRRTTAAGAAKSDYYQPRVDQQALDANPMTWLRRKFSSDGDEE